MASPKLTVTPYSIDAGCLLRVEGTIDESTDIQSLLATGAEAVVYDLDGVRRITSYGVLQWVKALKELRAKYYGFMRCHPCIVRQFNMVAGFGKRGEVLSVYLPYFCETCDVEFETLLDLRTDFAVAQSGNPPDVRCATCNAVAEFDDVPQSYLSFASEYSRPNPPELAVRLINEVMRGANPRARSMSPPARSPMAAPSPNPAILGPFGAPDTKTMGSPDSKIRSSPPPALPERSLTHAPESVDRLRKLQDDLDVTRDRLSKMIKDRKSKT